MFDLHVHLHVHDTSLFKSTQNLRLAFEIWWLTSSYSHCSDFGDFVDMHGELIIMPELPKTPEAESVQGSSTSSRREEAAKGEGVLSARGPGKVQNDDDDDESDEEDEWDRCLSFSKKSI